MIAGFPPSELQALRCREIYLHTRGLSGEVGPVDADVKVRAQRALLDRWRVSLDMIVAAPGLRVLDRPYKLPCTADPATRRGVTWPHTTALLYAGGGGVVGLSRPSLHHTWDGHCGGFSRLESGTTIPLSPEAVWCPRGFPSS